MTRGRGAVTHLILTLCLLPHDVAGQSNQRFSAQGSALFARLSGSAYQGSEDGFGGELQLRYTHSAWSFGVGLQRTDHALVGFTEKIRLAGVFFEPRYVVVTSSDRVAPYLSARFSVLQQHLSVQGVTSSAAGLTANLGGGILVRAARRMNLEGGATFGYTSFSDFSLRQPNGTTSRGPSGAGTNIVARLGLAFGVYQ